MGQKKRARAEASARFVINVQERLRTGCGTGVFINCDCANIRKLCRLITEHCSFNPVNVVAEIKVNTRHDGGSGKCIACPQAIAVESKDSVIPTIEHVRTVNFKLHLSMRSGVVRVAEANIYNRLRSGTEGRNTPHGSDVVSHGSSTRCARLQLHREVLKADFTETVFVGGRCRPC